MDTDKAVDAHLAEYQALRSESTHYSQRIDTVVGVYLTALFAGAGYVLRPDGEFEFTAYIDRVQASNGLMALYVFVAILNSALIIRIVSFFAAVLAITQYTHFFIRSRISALVREEILCWDGPPALSAKLIWIPLRLAGQFTFLAIAEFLTIFIFVMTHGLLSEGPLLCTFYIIGFLTFIASLAAVIATFIAGLLYHQPNALLRNPPDART